MGFRVKIRFQPLVLLTQQLRDMPNRLERAARVTGDETLRLIEEGFGDEKSPDGEKWAPRVRNGGHPILTKSGRLRGSFRLIPLRRGFIVRNSTPYASFHMTGTKRMVSRPFLPKRGRVPAAWRKRWVETIRNELLRGLR